MRKITNILTIMLVFLCFGCVNDSIDHTKHTYEYIPYEETHFKQFTCGCPSPEIVEFHYDHDNNSICDACGFTLKHIHNFIEGLCDCGEFDIIWLNENFDISEEQWLFSGSADDDFNCDVILLTLKHTTTYIQLSKRHFKIDCITKVEYVGGPRPPEYYFKEEYKYLLDKYNQIVFLHVENQSKSQIIELIRELEKLEFVQSASPNHIESPDV